MYENSVPTLPDPLNAERPSPNSGHAVPEETPPISGSPTAPRAARTDQTNPARDPEPSEDTFELFLNSFDSKADEELVKRRPALIRTLALSQVRDRKLLDDYNIVVLYDNGPLVKDDADKIYNAITQFTIKKPILLVLYSNGGRIEPAYLVSKLCRENAEGRFVVVVPRQAKSAATLICCGANEIHMGALSELGPIDPQIDGLPTLGLKNSIEHVAEMVNKYPSSADMFAKYLHGALPLIHLGYYERVAESAKQYAERLLSNPPRSLPASAAEIARHLVYTYKDHSFVIDRAEALSIFGGSMIRTDTPEYRFGNDLYEQLSFITYICDHRGFDFWWVGSIDTDCVTFKRKK